MKKLTPTKNLVQAPSIVKCGVSHIWVLTHIFAHSGQCSKRLSDFKHLYLSQMTTENDKHIKI